jgi:cytochrome c-type biogenesis protein CcmH/NrfG
MSNGGFSSATTWVGVRAAAAAVSVAAVVYTVPANYRQVEVNEVVKKHSEAIMANTVVPSAASMRAFHQELQTVLDQPRGAG